jgi:hypothetical protein
MRWKFVLPVIGLLLFAVVTIASVRSNRMARVLSSRYFWWSAIRLDRDPLGEHAYAKEILPCEESVDSNCIGWDFETCWVDPGLLTRLLFLAALPAFVVEEVLVNRLGQLGVNQVWTFFATTPPLIIGWFYLVGWLIDRWRLKRRARSEARFSTGN